MKDKKAKQQTKQSKINNYNDERKESKTTMKQSKINNYKDER
jgi:hypothetical protein